MEPLSRRRFLRLGALLVVGLTGGGSILAEVLQKNTSEGGIPAASERAVRAAVLSPTSSLAAAPPYPPAAAVPTGAPGGPAALPPAPLQLVRWPVPTPGLAPRLDVVHRVPILMYHRIVDPAQAGDSLPGLVVPPALFAAQLHLLQLAGWRTITAAELAVALQHGAPLEPRTLVVTIDDGWDDGYREALPALQAVGYRATYYVIGRRIGATGFLDGGQLRALAAAGMEIGDHTFDHRSLPLLAPPMRRYEILAAADRIAQVVGQAPVTFCYPDGRSSTDLQAQVEEAGFGLALTTREGSMESWPTRYDLPRIRVTPSTSPAGLLARLEIGSLLG